MSRNPGLFSADLAAAQVRERDVKIGVHTFSLREINAADFSAWTALENDQSITDAQRIQRLVCFCLYDDKNNQAPQEFVEKLPQRMIQQFGSLALELSDLTTPKSEKKEN